MNFFFKGVRLGVEDRMDLPACVKISGNRFLRRKDTQKSYLFCYLPHLSTEKESLRFKGSVINIGSLFSAPNDFF